MYKYDLQVVYDTGLFIIWTNLESTDQLQVLLRKFSIQNELNENNQANIHKPIKRSIRQSIFNFKKLLMPDLYIKPGQPSNKKS